MNTFITLLVIFLVILIVGFVSSVLRQDGSDNDPPPPSYDPPIYPTPDRYDPPIYPTPRPPRERCYYINKRNHRNDEKIARHKANQWPL